MDARIESMDARIESMDARMDAMNTGFDRLEKAVDRNYDKAMEFYVSQQEHNTMVSDTLDLLSGKLELFADQTIRNTLAIRRYN